MDQFHALGLAATLALAELAEVEPGERVLDLGAGIGGPARVLASRFGARVVAVEPTARFRRLAAELHAATDLEDAIEVVDAHGHALPFPDGSFDLIWTQAVLANVAELAPFAEEAHRVLAQAAAGRSPTPSPAAVKDRVDDVTLAFHHMTEVFDPGTGGVQPGDAAGSR